MGASLSPEGASLDCDEAFGAGLSAYKAHRNTEASALWEAALTHLGKESDALHRAKVLLNLSTVNALHTRDTASASEKRR